VGRAAFLVRRPGRGATQRTGVGRCLPTSNAGVPAALRTPPYRRADPFGNGTLTYTCLKRYIARAIYRILVKPSASISPPADGDQAQRSAIAS
jgi:hypothetical protein